MRFRLKALALHVLSSACVLTLTLGLLYLGWYRWPGWYLTGARHVLVILIVVDLLLGPTLTMIIANPKKRRPVLVRDVTIIASVQILALIYGVATLWQGRPLYYTFSVDRLEMVQASDLEKSEIILARQRNPELAPYWYSLPRWIWAPLPDNEDEAGKIVGSAVFGGQDVIDMPRYFRPWQRCAAQVRKNLSLVADIKYLSMTQKQSVQQRMRKLELVPEQRNTMILWGAGRYVLAVFDPTTAQLKALLAPD